MAGYSGTPLARKLGVKPGDRVYVERGPRGYAALLAPLPAGATVSPRPGQAMRMVHLFVTARRELASALRRLIRQLAPEGMIWVWWSKRSSGVPTDVTEDVIRQVALPLGLVDTKVCAVDEVWSGLRLVIRKERRAALGAPPA